MLRALSLLAFALLSLLSLSSAQTCVSTGLPTSGNGSYALSNASYSAAAVSAWGSYSVEWSTIAVTVAPITSPSGTTYPTGSWVWWGTQQTVTISPDQGMTWTQLTASNDYNGTTGNAQCAHRASFNRFYVLGDELGYAQTNSSFVYSSTNGYSWQQMLSAATNAQWATRQLGFTGCVVDMQDRLYSLGPSDVWMSTNYGMTFTNVTQTMYTPPRASFGNAIFAASYGDVMMVVGGLKPNYAGDLNDVWASQGSSGAVWLPRTTAAPWAARNSMNVAFSTSGVLVMHGGIQGGGPMYFGDTWVSLDLGATWQILAAQSGVNRSGAATVLDSAGYFYIFSGQNQNLAQNNNYFCHNTQAHTPQHSTAHHTTHSTSQLTDQLCMCVVHVRVCVAACREQGRLEEQLRGEQHRVLVVGRHSELDRGSERLRWLLSLLQHHRAAACVVRGCPRVLLRRRKCDLCRRRCDRQLCRLRVHQPAHQQRRLRPVQQHL